MAALTDVHRAYIVEQLACFAALDEVAAGLKTLFGLEVPKQTIHRYDPTTVQGERELAAKWKTAFQTRRAAYLADVSAAPIASQAYRLQELGKLYAQSKARGALVIAADMLEQAAKETGGHFTARRDAAPSLESSSPLLTAFERSLDKIYGDKPAPPAQPVGAGPAPEAQPSESTSGPGSS